MASRSFWFAAASRAACAVLGPAAVWLVLMAADGAVVVILTVTGGNGTAMLTVSFQPAPDR